MTSRGPSNQGKIRVLINGLHAKSGGGVTYLRNILPYFVNDDRLEFHLAIHKSQHDLFAPFDHRLKLHEYDFKAGFWRLLIWEQFVLPIKARAIAPEITFSPGNYGPIFVPSSIIMLQNALAVGRVETRPTKRLYWAGLAIMTALSLARCTRAIAISKYAYEGLGFGLGQWFKNKIDVIYHGVSTKFSPSPKSPGIAPYLLVVSDIYIQKNLDTLIEALKIIREQFPDLTLKIAGHQTDKPYYETLTELIVRQGLEDHVEFTGVQNMESLVGLYRDCAVFVLPSTVETFGFPLLEAMACGAPVATSNSAALPEIAGTGATLFDPLDARDMAKKITHVMEDHDFAKKLVKRGERQAAQYRWDLTAQQTTDLFIEIAGR